MSRESYPAYKPSGIPWLGDVPDHWEVLRGKALLRPVDIRSDTGGEELLTVSAQRGVIPRKSANVTMFKAESYVGYKLCWPGDLVINSLWAWANGLGVSQHHGIISSAYGVYRPLPKADARFIHLLGRSGPFQWELQVRSKGIWVSRLQLTDEEFLGAPFPLPPLLEQAAIACYLDHVDRRIRRYVTAKRKLIALLAEEKQAVINRAVTRGLDPNVRLKPSGVEWLGDVPEHWEVRRLKRVLYSLIDCEHKTAPAVDVSSYRVVRTSAVRGGTLLLSGTYCTSKEAFAEWTRRGRPEPGDVIFTREAPAGEACVVPSSLNLCLGQRTVLMKVDRSDYEPQFLVHMLYTGPPHDEIELASQGSTLPHFNVEDIGALPVLAPPVSEQRAIVDWLEAETGDLTYAISRARRQIELLQEYRTRLVADVVTGKLDVREAAALLPNESENEDPTDEGNPLVEDTYEDSHDPDVTAEELAMESEVTV